MSEFIMYSSGKAIKIKNSRLTIAEQTRDAMGALFLKEITDKGGEIEIPSLGIVIKEPSKKPNIFK